MISRPIHDHLVPRQTFLKVSSLVLKIQFPSYTSVHQFGAQTDILTSQKSGPQFLKVSSLVHLLNEIQYILLSHPYYLLRKKNTPLKKTPPITYYSFLFIYQARTFTVEKGPHLTIWYTQYMKSSTFTKKKDMGLFSADLVRLRYEISIQYVYDMKKYIYSMES